MRTVKSWLQTSLLLDAAEHWPPLHFLSSHWPLLLAPLSVLQSPRGPARAGLGLAHTVLHGLSEASPELPVPLGEMTQLTNGQ